MDISSIFDFLVWLSFLEVFLFAVPVGVSLTAAVLDSMVIGFSMLNDTIFGLLFRDWSMGTDCALSSCEFRLHTLRVSLCQLVSRCVKCWLPFVIETTSDRDGWSMMDILKLIFNFRAVNLVCMSSWRYKFVSWCPGIKYAACHSFMWRYQKRTAHPWLVFQSDSQPWKLFWFLFLTNFTFTIRLLISMLCWLSFHNLIPHRGYFGVVKSFRLWACRKCCSIFS